MSRRLFIAGNWKMNKTAAEAVETVKGLAAEVADITNVDIAVFPTFLSVLAAAKEAAEGTNINVGTQNIHFAESGAYTGEVSAAMLKEHGISHAVIGHRKDVSTSVKQTRLLTKELVLLLKRVLLLLLVSVKLLKKENLVTWKKFLKSSFVKVLLV